MSFRNVSGIYEKNLFTLIGCNDFDICLSIEVVRWEDRSFFFFCRKVVDVLRKVSMKFFIEIFILSKKEFKLFNCVFLGKRILRKY